MKAEIIEKIKTDVSILDVAAWLGITLSKNGGTSHQGNCPSGHPSKSGTCFSIPDGANYFHCFSCGEGGDVIRLVEMTKKVSFRDAVKALCLQFCPSLADSIGTEHVTADPKQAEIYRKAAYFKELFDYGKKKLHYSPAAQACRDYLTNERGYRLELLQNTDWIYFPPWKEAIEHLTHLHPESAKEIQDLKLNGYYGDNFRLAFPYRDIHGTITGFLKRSTCASGVTITTKDQKVCENVRWDSSAGTDKTDLFGLHLCRNEEELIIVEGYPDAIYLPQLGIKNVVAVGQGILGRTHVDSILRCKTKKAVLALDNDPLRVAKDGQMISSGEENTIKAIEALKKSGLEIFVLPPSCLGECKDPDEYVREYSADQFRDLLPQAQYWWKWMAEYHVRRLVFRENAYYEGVEAKYDQIKRSDKLFAQFVTLLAGIESQLPQSQRPAMSTYLFETFGLKFKKAKKEVLAEDSPGGNQQPAAPFVFSPELLSENLIVRDVLAKNKDNLRFSAKSGHWYVWDGTRWVDDANDSRNRILQMVVDSLNAHAKNDAVLRELGIEDKIVARYCSWVSGLYSTSRMSSIMGQMELDPDVLIDDEAFDSQPYLLNCPNGTVDLRTGQLSPHDKKQYLTKKIRTNYNQRATHNKWDVFLSEIFKNDYELIEFIQTAIGYSITGETTERMFFTLYGSGSNGKSTMINVMLKIIGGYGDVSDISSFLEQKYSNSIRSDIARLKGVRLCSTSEPNASRRLDTGYVKKITGRSAVTARKLHENEITFTPVFKLWLETNDKPIVDSDDIAIWKRMCLVPFTYACPPEKANRTLEEDLLQSAEGVLLWAIDGAVAWYKNGLVLPECVKRENAAYRDEMDRIGSFLKEFCVTPEQVEERPDEDEFNVRASTLYKAYSENCQECRESPLSNQQFYRRLVKKGFEKKPMGANQLHFIGLRMASDHDKIRAMTITCRKRQEAEVEQRPTLDDYEFKLVPAFTGAIPN